MHKFSLSSTIMTFKIRYRTKRTPENIRQHFSTINLVCHENDIESLHVTFGITILSTIMHLVQEIQKTVAQATAKKAEQFPTTNVSGKFYTASFLQDITSRQRASFLITGKDSLFSKNKPTTPQNADLKISTFGMANEPEGKGINTKDEKNYEILEKARFQYKFNLRASISDVQIMVLTADSAYVKNYLKVF